MDKVTQKEIDQMNEDYNREMVFLAKKEKEQWENVKQISISHKSAKWWDELKEYLEFESCYFNPKIVDKSKGDFQEIGDGELIKEEWVNQTTNGGYTGDDFAGTIYFKLKDSVFIELEYSM